MSKKKHTPACAECGVPLDDRVCRNREGKGGKSCPTLVQKDVIEQANREYEDPAVMKFARQASIQEAECYVNRYRDPYVLQPSKTRIVEICEFAEKMGYKKLGLAFCIGLAREAGIVDEIFRARGFEVVSAVCKTGMTSKDFLGLDDEHKVRPGTFETMCNPVAQAKLMNENGAELNVLLGLCVGHDSLFFKYAEAPTTVLAVKDRVTGHNPLAAVYLAHSYYCKVKTEV